MTAIEPQNPSELPRLPVYISWVVDLRHEYNLQVALDKLQRMIR